MSSDNGGYELGSTSIVLRPNRSLPIRGVAALFAGLSTLILAIGLGFAWIGAWVVLLFGLVQIVAVGALCIWCYRHLDDCELVVIGVRRVVVIRRCAGREMQSEFPRPWVRLSLERGRDEYDSSRLCIGSHGKCVRLAESCSEVDRLFLAHELRSALRPPVYI